MAPYTPSRHRTLLPVVLELDEHAHPAPPTRDPPPPPPSQPRREGPAAQRERQLSSLPVFKLPDAGAPALPVLPIVPGAKSFFDWDEKDSESKGRKRRKGKEKTQGIPESPISGTAGPELGISEIFGAAAQTPLSQEKLAKVATARAVVQQRRVVTANKVKQLEKEGWRRSQIQQTLYGGLDGQKCAAPVTKSPQSAADDALLCTSSNESTALVVRKTRIKSDASTEAPNILRSIKSWKSLRSGAVTPPISSTQLDKASSSTDLTSPERQILFSDIFNELHEDVPPVPAIPSQYRAKKIRQYFSTSNLRSKSSTAETRTHPLTTSTPKSRPDTSPDEDVARTSREQSSLSQTQGKHAIQDENETRPRPAIQGHTGTPPLSHTLTPTIFSTPASTLSQSFESMTSTRRKSPHISSPSESSTLSQTSPSPVPAFPVELSIPDISPSLAARHRRRDNLSSFFINTATTSATSRSSTPTQQKPVLSIEQCSVSATPLQNSTTPSLAEVDPGFWFNSVRVVRERMQQEAEEERKKEREELRAGKRVDRDSKKSMNRKISNAQKLTSGLIEKFRDRGVTPMKTVEEMTEEDFNFVATSCNRGSMETVRNFLFSPSSQRTSADPAKSGKGKQAAGNEPSPYGLGIDSGVAGASPTLGRGGKIRMTPDLQQELVLAKAAREERLKAMPCHPCLRGDSDKSPRGGEVRQGSPQTMRLLRAGECDTSRSSGSDLGISIDDAIRDWEQSTPCPAVGDALAEGLSNDLQALRQEFGLGPLRGPRRAAQKHPQHSLHWYSKKLMCRSIHNPMEILPKLPPFTPGDKVNMKDLDKKFFENTNAGEYTAPKKCESELCEEYCCHYGKLLVNSVAGSTDILEVSQAMKCAGEARKLIIKVPMGTDGWESFVQCVHCFKMFCPGCITLCGRKECQQAQCFTCSNDSSCQDHQA